MTDTTGARAATSNAGKKKRRAPANKKKTAARTAKKKKTAARRSADGDRKIRVVTRTNPRRPDTVQHARYAAILRADGRTVDEFLAGGGDRTALTYAVRQGHVRV